MGKTDQRERQRSRRVDLKVAKVTDANDPPIVVAFPGGLPESAENSNVKPPKFVWQKLSEKNKRARKVVGYDKYCLYSASAQGRLYDDRQTKLCVGVYDKKLGSVVLHEAASKGTVFSLQQSVPTYNIQNNSRVTKTSAEQPNIFVDFGSQKKRKVLKSQAANRVDVDFVIGAGEKSAVVSQIMKGQGMSESNKNAIEDCKQAKVDRKSANEVAIEKARKHLIPEYDERAIEPKHIFNAKNIAGERAWDRMHRKVKACLHQEDPINAVLQSVMEKDWSSFVIKVINEVNPENNNAAYRITCAIIVNWMVRFYVTNKNRRSMEDVNEEKGHHFGIPTEIASKCLESFATALPPRMGAGGVMKSSGYIMSKQNKEKCVVHILLLLMMTSGAAMKINDLGDVAETLQLPASDCSSFLKYAGCSITKNGKMMGATLKAPLKFPKAGRGYRNSR